MRSLLQAKHYGIRCSRFGQIVGRPYPAHQSLHARRKILNLYLNTYHKFESFEGILKQKFLIFICNSYFPSELWVAIIRKSLRSSLYLNNNKEILKIFLKIPKKILNKMFFAIFYFKIMNMQGIHEIDAWKKSWICEGHELWNHEMQGPPVPIYPIPSDGSTQCMVRGSNSITWCEVII